jgi:hypothetical protein
MATRVVNRLPQFVDSRERAAARGMTQAMVLGAAEASVLTPIDTSFLLNSQYKNVRKEPGRGIVGTVGYTADYALPVHDPSNPQNFRRATAEKEFLKNGFERAEPAIRGVLKAAVKV